MYKQKSLTHRILAMLLAIVMMVGYLPTAWAAPGDTLTFSDVQSVGVGQPVEDVEFTFEYEDTYDTLQAGTTYYFRYRVDVGGTPVVKSFTMPNPPADASDLLPGDDVDIAWNNATRTLTVTGKVPSYSNNSSPTFYVNLSKDIDGGTQIKTENKALPAVPEKPVITLTVPITDVTVGEWFTVSAKSTKHEGKIRFYYGDSSKDVDVDINGYAEADFRAAEGEDEVSAVHLKGTNYIKSDRAEDTIHFTPSTPVTYKIIEGSNIGVTALTDLTAVAEGTVVKFTVTDSSATIITVVGDSGEGYDFNATGENTYSFRMPAENVTVSAAVQTKEPVNFALSLHNAKDGAKVTGETMYAGQTVSAHARVATNPGWHNITDAIGAIVKFTWPDGTSSYGYVDQNGWANAEWTIPDSFADSIVSGTANWDLKPFSAQFFGTEKYESHTPAGYALTDTKNLRIRSRTIAQGTAAIAVDGTGSLAVNKTSTLSLSGEVKDSQGVVLTKDTDYTVAWYVNTGNGVWNPCTEFVTPKSTSYSYKAVVSPKGNQYSQGEFELVVSCGTEDTSVFGSTAAITVVEGDAFTVSAVVNGTNNGGAAVAGGSVAFWANDIYLGTAPIVAGQAGLTVDGTKLSEGTYDLKAAYSGTPGVFSSIALADLNVDIEVASATLDSNQFTLKNTVDSTDSSELVVGKLNSLTLDGGAYNAADYSIIWQVSKDGGVSWAEAARTEKYELTPENNLYQVRAVVMPEGKYTKPVNGFVVGLMACSATDLVETKIKLSAVPTSVFAGDTVVLTAVVTDENGNAVSSGSVTITGNGSSITLPVDQGGMVQYIVPVTATTTFEAEYNGNDIYADCTKDAHGNDAKATVTVKSRTIKLVSNDITYTGTMEVGQTVTLTAPDVQSTDGYSLTAGTHFYYQWQYCEDYDGTGTDYTAIWKNFSAPDSDNGKTARVTIATANTAFRVIAVPYGDYRYPAQGVMTDPICGNSGKITTSIDKIDIASVQHGNVIYDGDDVQFKVQVKAGTANVPEGYVTFSVSQRGTSWRTIGTAVVNNSGVAVLDYKAYAGQVGKVSARYNATSRYKGCTTEADVTIKSVKIDTIEDASKIALATGSSWTVGTAATINLPTVKSTDGTPLSLGTDYFIEWFEDHGYGWSSKMLMYSGSDYTFTPQNENSKLAAIVRPMGNYSLPAEGVSAGVLSNAAKINTTTTLATSVASAYEGDEITLTATIEAGGNKVLDGKVDFYAKVGNATDSVCIGSASVNGEGKAILTYTLPAYATLTSSKDVVFSAKYLGTDAYAASEATATNSKTKTVTVKSATIAFGTNPTITIANAGGTTPIYGQPAVGTNYDLIAPDVYEQGTTSSALDCGTHYYYVWDRSIDGGVTWETVQSTTDANSKSLKNAIFVNDQTEFRATAYPITGSGSIYRYPVTGITVMTNTNPETKATTATVTLSNEYAKSGDVAIYPVGRDIVIKATVVTNDTDKAPATGKVTFYQKKTTDTDGTAIGSAFLNPVGEAEITIPAPAVEGKYIYYVKYAGNEVFTTVNSDASTVNAVVLKNSIKMYGALKIMSGSTEVTAPVVGVTYKLTGAYASVEYAYAGIDLSDYVAAANGKLSTDPYFYYQWQKSEDGGETWVSLDNPVASDSKPSLEVTFDTNLTQYRLAAYPIASTGWINPTTGVTSKAKGVGTTATTTTITLKDAAGVALADASQIFEESEIQVTVNVAEIADYIPGTTGYVTLTTYTKNASDVEYGKKTETLPVDRDGNVTFNVTLPKYSYDFATSKNEVFFEATFSGDDHFSTSIAAAKTLNLKSRAIAWNTSNTNTITIYKGTTTSKVTEMVANQDYTLKLPTITSADVKATATGTGRNPRTLTNGVEYTVDWQRQLKGGATQTGWQTIPTGNGGDTLYIASDAGAQDYSYRAVVIPKGDYQFAMKDDFSDLNPTNTLTTAATADTKLAATTTTLEVKDVIAEATDVAINGATNVFTAEHNTQYEGENVTLTATVKAGTQLVDDGYVDFYRNGQKINETSIKLSNGAASMTVPTSAWDTTKSVTANKDQYYAVYLGTDVYDKSESVTRVSDTDPTINGGLQDVYIRSTSIAVPRIKSNVANADGKDSTTATENLTNLPTAKIITFSLIENNKTSAGTDGFSVTAKDGRWLDYGTHYTVQWYREDKTAENGGIQTGADVAIDGATELSYATAFGTNWQEYSIHLLPIGSMKYGAASKKAIIGSKFEPILELDPGYTFEPSTADVKSTSVQVTPGAHYGDKVTLTATVKGENVCPTGYVTFYANCWNSAAGTHKEQLGEPVALAPSVTNPQKVAVAAYTFDASELPFDVRKVSVAYSGDDAYEAVDVTNNAVSSSKKEFKLWSVQISNSVREGVTLPLGSVDYSDPACYPDNKSYGNVEIKAYMAKDSNNDGIFEKDSVYTESALKANGDYILELQPIYTKSGEKLIPKMDNSGDVSIEWLASTDEGNTWSPVQVTELSDAEALIVYVKPADKDTRYAVKVTTNNSFYNSQKPELVDYEYSADIVEVQTQTVTVNVTAQAETPVAGNKDWVYQKNPITLFAEVTPSIENSGEPTGTVEFYYTEYRSDGNYSDTDIWKPVVSDTEDKSNTANLVKTTSATDTAGKMVASLTTSELPVSADGTYSNLVIKAIYRGDQTYRVSDNINGTTSINSEIVSVFSSVIYQQDTIENVEGVPAADKKGVIIRAKALKSDGTPANLELDPVYTLDVLDSSILSNDSIYKLLTDGSEYTVEWQYCADYAAYQSYLNGTDPEGRNWTTIPNSSSNDCSVEQIQGYAFRAKITAKDMPKTKAAYLNAQDVPVKGRQVIYSNILVVGDAEARVFNNIRKASSASKRGDTVSIDTFVMGGSTTPVGSTTVTVNEIGKEDTAFGGMTSENVFTDTKNLANGYVTRDWTNVQPGIYKIKTELQSNNGYTGETVENYIVRFTNSELKINVTDPAPTYDGQIKSAAASITGFGNYVGGGAYEDLEAKAKNSIVFQYYKDGQRVAEPVDAGTYTVKAYLPESKYWGYVEAEGKLTIQKREVTITDVIAQAKTYDGEKTANVQTVTLNQSAINDTTGLPTGSTGVIEGDSVYVQATAAFNSENVTEANTLTLTSATLAGPHKDNYVLTNPNYSEAASIARNQLTASAFTTIEEKPGYKLTDADFKMVDQQGNALTIENGQADITYYYHSGNDIKVSENTNRAGKYTVVIGKKSDNYKGGATVTLYVDNSLTRATEGAVTAVSSAMIDITGTYHVYDGTAKSVTVTPKVVGQTVEVSYAGMDTYSTTAPTAAGRYMVKATANGRTYYGIMTIVKGDPNASLTATTKEYTGSRYDGAPVLTEGLYASNKTNDPYGDLYYSYVGGSIVGSSLNAPRDVSYVVGSYIDSVTSGAYGTYVVSAHVPETANTIRKTVSAEFEITKAPLTVTAEDVYTRLFDTNSKMTSIYEGFKDGNYGEDNSIRDFIALPTYTIVGLDQESMNNVGPFVLAPSDINVRNYAVTYVNGQITINDQSTQAPLEIRSELGNDNVVYYGQKFKVSLYGSRVDAITNESSVVTYEIITGTDVAEIDASGNVTVKGVGSFTIKATRGDDERAISTTETFTAKKRANEIVIARDDYLYDGSNKSIKDANYSFYYMDNGTWFKNTASAYTTSNQPQQASGIYKVTATINDTVATEVGNGAGLLGIHRVNATVTADPKSMTYGSALPTDNDYTCSTHVGAEKALTNGVTAIDARANSDVGSYEILVAGGKEGHNYNVTYAKSDSDHDFDITAKDLNVQAGMLKDTQGETLNWRTAGLNATLAGLFENIPGAVDAFQTTLDRMFGERNRVLDNEVTGLITGDSMADLLRGGQVEAFTWLAKDKALSAEAAANRKYPSRTDSITSENSTVHGNATSTITAVESGAIDGNDYVITTSFADSTLYPLNYDVNASTGTQNVYRRPVTIAPQSAEDPIIINAGEYTNEKLVNAILNQANINGLADNLKHTYKDLLMYVSKVGSTTYTESQNVDLSTPGTTTITLTIGNTNYCSEGTVPFEITVDVTVANVKAPTTVYNKQRTNFKVRIYKEITAADGSKSYKPAVINNLEFRIVNADNPSQILAQGVMNYTGNEQFNGITQAVYTSGTHNDLYGYDVLYLFRADGYIFSQTW